MGISHQELEMLFVAPEFRGHGLGKQLINYGIKNFDVNKLTVNEQNPQAIGFYQHLGFKTYRRTETDDAGNPYPILYMKK
ncbi:GNAT family N-acetyltransferase [Companilactobacillus bobalius]